MHIPVRFGFLGKDGKDLIGTQTLHLKEAKQVFTFDNIAEKPVPSILRGFSAPVKLSSDLTDGDLLFLMSHDSDGFNRWDAGQTYLQRLILSKPKTLPEALFTAFGKLLEDKSADKALIAKALALPSEGYLAQLQDVIDVDGIYAARKLIVDSIGKKHLETFRRIYAENAETGPYSVAPEAVGRRRLKNAALRYIQGADENLAVELALAQYKAAGNMTDKVAALAILTDTKSEAHSFAFEDFYKTWKSDPLVLDKWFSLQAIADREDAPEQVTRLLQHPDFTYKNPNRLRALVGSFAGANPKWFHRADGAGYSLLADTVIRLNAINPSTAARILTPLRQWRKYDASRRQLMEGALKRILSEKGISNDVYEIVSKSLG